MKYADAAFDAFMRPLEAGWLSAIRPLRAGRASGDVLEIGAGTGSNIRYYNRDALSSLTLTDLEPGERLNERAGDLNGVATVVAADASALPFANASFDGVVSCLVLCSVPDQSQVLSEIRRVLRPGGRLFFVEHVRPSGGIGRLFDRINPLWHRFTGECNLNRETLAAIEAAGFELVDEGSFVRGVFVHGEAVAS